MRLLLLVCVSLCLSAAPGPVSGADRTCTDLRQLYTGKGFTLVEVPQTEISGEFSGVIEKNKNKNKTKNTTYSLKS